MRSTLRHHSVILRWKSLTHSVWVFTVRDALGIMLDALTAEASSLVQSTSWRLQGCGGKKIKQMPLNKCAKCVHTGSFQFIFGLRVLKCVSKHSGGQKWQLKKKGRFW